MAGEVIAGRFELIEHIAQGGSGSVWLARDLECSQRCAAKVMRQSYSGEVLRFVREQGVKFDHPHLLTPYGWAAVDDCVVIASELMRGGNLHTAMQDYGAFSAELVAEILVQLLEGLDHVHASGWIHRDVKPANVLLELTGTAVPRVRLTDFGIATHRDQPRLTQLGITVGTEAFLAPEQRAGKDPEPAQDLYALGVLAAQLLEPTLYGEALRTRCRDLAAGIDVAPGPLGRILQELLSDEPGLREEAASRAEQVLRPLRNPGGYKVASGEIFEVFDHFAENGDSVPPAEVPPPVARQPQPVSRPASPPASAPVEVETGGATSGRAPLPWMPWVLVALALLLGALSLWLVFGAGQAQPAGPASSVHSASSAATPAAESSSAVPSTVEPSTPATDAAPAAASPSSVRQTLPVVQVSGTPLDLPVSSNVSAGERCTALEAGLIVNGTAGHRLSCGAYGAAYRWEAVD